MIVRQKNTIQNTKQRIIKTARRLFAKYTYLGVSMSDIAKKLNITKAALYYHFSSKAELYKKVIDDAMSSLQKIINEASKENTSDKKLYKLVKNYLDFGLKEKILISILTLKLTPADSLIKKHILNIREQINNLIQPIVKEAFLSNKKDEQINIETATFILIGMMHGILLEHSVLGKKLDTEEMSKHIISILFK